MKNRGRISGHGLRVLAAIAFTMMIVSAADGDFSRQYAAAGGGWEYVYIGSVDSTYWFYNGAVRFGFDHGKGQWWHHGISWSILSGTGLSDAFIGDGAIHSLNNGWWYSYAASIGGGYWNTGSATRFSYDYTWGRWWSYSSWGAWRAMSAAGLSQAFIGDGVNHDVGNGWWYAYAKPIDSGYWNSGAAVRFGYDYNAGQWWDHSTGSNTWLSLGDWAQTQAFIGDGVYHPLSNGWQYKYNKGVDRSYWMTGDKERFCYHYDTGRWWDWGTGWYELSAERVSQSFIGDGAANNLFNGFNYQYDSGLDIGYWLLGAANRFSYAYGNGQWSHYGAGAWSELGNTGSSAAFMGDTAGHDLGTWYGAQWLFTYNVLEDSGEFARSLTSWDNRFAYDYVDQQWSHYGAGAWSPVGNTGYSAAFIGDGAGHELGTWYGVDWGFMYVLDLDSGGFARNISDVWHNRFAYDYTNQVWLHYGAGVWSLVGNGGYSADFIGDGTPHALGTWYGQDWWFQYDTSVLDRGMFSLASGGSYRFAFGYADEQWFHYGPTDTDAKVLSTTGRSSLFVAVYDSATRLDVGNGLGYWYDSASGTGYWWTNGAIRFHCVYNDGQWFHYGPPDATGQKLSADGVQVSAKFVGDYTGVGSDKLDLGNGYDYWYVIGDGEGYWSEAGTDRFKYTYAAGQWWNNIGGVWQTLGSLNASAAFVGDGTWHTLGSVSFMWDGALSFYNYDANHYYRVDPSGDWEFRVAAGAAVWLGVPSGVTPDGSWSPAQLALDIRPGSGSSYPEFLTVFNDVLYFRAYDATHGYELWKYDGATASLVWDIWPGSTSSYPAYLAVFNNALYFQACDATHGYELWKYDGATASMVLDIWPDSTSSYPMWMTVFNDALYFSAQDATHGYELWKYDGASVSLVADIRSGPDSSGPRCLTVFNNALYFSADDGFGLALWVMDAYENLAETIALYGLFPAVYNGSLYFHGYDSTHGSELWRWL